MHRRANLNTSTKEAASVGECPCIALLNRITPDATSRQLTATPEGKRTLLRGGLACGMILFAASNLQQIGIQYTTVGKAGFITALYIILVPIFSLFLKKKCGVNVWIGVFLALIGFYPLTMKGSFSLSSGDLLVLLGKGIRVIKIPGNGCFGKTGIFCDVTESYIFFTHIRFLSIK